VRAIIILASPLLAACASLPADRQACRDAALEREVIDVLITEADAGIAGSPPGPERLALRHRLQDLGAAGVEASRKLNTCEARDGGIEVTPTRADIDAFLAVFDRELRPRYADEREQGVLPPYVAAGTRYGEE